MVALFAPRAALAVPCTGVDADADGWCRRGPGQSNPPDCADFDPTVNPHAAEDGLDDRDNDCDGTMLVRRSFVSSMSGAAAFPVPGAGIRLTGGASLSTVNGDNQVVVPAGAGLQVNGPVPHVSGQFTAVVRVTAQTGAPSCWLTVTTPSGSASVPVPGTGTHSLAFPHVRPGESTSLVRFDCSGAGSQTVDWLTTQSGAYTWAPMSDLGSSWSTMGLPGVGRQSLVRASVDPSGGIGSLMFVGSDVGGLGWSEDGYAWTTANGLADEWIHDGHYGVWEVWAQEEEVLDVETQVAFALTGNRDTAEDGGLWWTSNLGAEDQSWSEVLTDDEVPLSLGASKHFDDSGELGSKPIGSGRLIVREPGGAALLVASGDPDTRGLWEVDSAAPAVATYSLLNASLPDAIPSALAVDASETYLLVGFRPVDVSAGNQTALYLCPAQFSSSGEACVPVGDDADVVWSGDVRDIEPHPSEAGVFYVADGGRTCDATGCDTGESTVFAVEASGTFGTDAAGTLFDTDAVTTAAGPSWTGGASYYAAKNCQSGASGSVVGELVPPLAQGSEGAELSSVAVDPSGDYVFAFFPFRDNKREYGCVGTFRAAVSEVATHATPWLPFQGWEDQRMSFSPGSSGLDNLHPSTRAAHVAVTGASADFDAFMVAEPLLASWAGAATHDAAFVWDGSAGYELMTGGNFLWLVGMEYPEEGEALGVSGPYGWNTPHEVDGSGDVVVESLRLDQVDWELAWDGESPVFQDASVRSVASCPACEQAGGGLTDAVLVSGVGDYKMARLHGVDAAGARPAADRQCEVHNLSSAGGDVAIWPGDANSIAQAWMAMNPQDSTSNLDTNAARGLMYLDDLSQDDRWCWDAMTASNTDGITSLNYLSDDWINATGDPTLVGDGYNEMQCQDSSLLAWYSGGSIPGEWLESCVQDGTGPYHMAAAGVGQIRSLAPYADAATLAAAAPGEVVGGTTTIGEGLWVVQYTGAAGLSYLHVPFPATGLHGGGVCTEAEFFAWTSQVEVVLHSTQATGLLRAFLSSRDADCGVAEVLLDPSGATSPVWSPVSLSGCDLDVPQLRGVSTSRDGRWLFAYGGPHTSSAGGGVCAVDLNAAYAAQDALPGTDADILFKVVLPHPHLDDTFFAAGYWSDGAEDTPGVYVIERRWQVDGAPFPHWDWHSRRLSGDDLEQRRIEDLDWGSGYDATGAGLLRHLYLATAGGGPVDGLVAVE